jgi:hypothetical protein
MEYTSKVELVCDKLTKLNIIQFIKSFLQE